MWDVKGDTNRSAPALVLVGGGLTGYLSWVPHQERLAADRRVVRVQLVAVEQGLAGAALPPDYSVDLESRSLAVAIDATTSGPIDLVAWSYGAAISLDYALGHGARIHTLTLIEPPAFWTLDATGSLDAQSKRESDDLRALYRSMKARGDVSEDNLVTFLHGAGIVPLERNPRDVPAWPSWVRHRRSLLAGDAPWTHTDTRARLAAFDRPVLLVKGTGSSHFLHRIIDALASALPRSETIELPGGHSPQLVAMDDFLARMSAFQAR